MTDPIKTVQVQYQETSETWWVLFLYTENGGEWGNPHPCNSEEAAHRLADSYVSNGEADQKIWFDSEGEWRGQSARVTLAPPAKE